MHDRQAITLRLDGGHEAVKRRAFIDNPRQIAEKTAGEVVNAKSLAGRHAIQHHVAFALDAALIIADALDRALFVDEIAAGVAQAEDAERRADASIGVICRNPRSVGPEEIDQRAREYGLANAALFRGDEDETTRRRRESRGSRSGGRRTFFQLPLVLSWPASGGASREARRYRGLRARKNQRLCQRDVF